MENDSEFLSTISYYIDVLDNRYPEIPWSAVKGIRNILAHDYFNIDPEEIYQICANDLPILKQVLVKIRSELF
jgi:uncharacterized protein with HEPN domain